MIPPPIVSVVLAFRGGAETLGTSICGILEQTFPDFELVLVDDGSPDAARCEAQIPHDPRIRLIRTPATGLTAALNLGCASARGEFIARHDNGDVSMGARLAEQVAALQAAGTVGFVCGATEFVSPDGELLFVSTGGPEAKPGIPTREIRLGTNGPSHHGAVMFRRSLFEAVCGYREVFRLAQDWDLWFRLIEHSQFLALDTVHYRAWINPYGLSLAHPGIQRKFGDLADQCHMLRVHGLDEFECLRAAERLHTPLARSRKNPAAGWYFVGCLLADQGKVSCRKYFLRSLQANPLYLKSWVRWALSFVWAGPRAGTRSP